MHLQDLDFSYPESLVATERKEPTRVMAVKDGEPRELDLAGLVAEFRSGDLLVVNDTRVIKRRVFAESGLEILFLSSADDRTWRVLCPTSRWKTGVKQTLPGGIELTLIERGRTQVVEASQPLTSAYFETYGELPLPPYIQKARGDRHNRALDSREYQTAWSRVDGSLAAPTASLHFAPSHLEALQAKGVRVAFLTLHVGLGTFLPINVDDLDEHEMHEEQVEIPRATWQRVLATKASDGRVWALGTTATRSLEAAAHGRLAAQDGGFRGATDLFIRPGFEFRAVDCLLTNFHQPRSTLLALVAAFNDLAQVKRHYEWAIARDFRLFSYGDLTAWIR